MILLCKFLYLTFVYHIILYALLRTVLINRNKLSLLEILIYIFPKKPVRINPVRITPTPLYFMIGIIVKIIIYDFTLENIGRESTKRAII